MRYGLEVQGRPLERDVTAFPGQPSVLDQDALLQRVVGRFSISKAGRRWSDPWTRVGEQVKGPDPHIRPGPVFGEDVR